MPETRTRTGYLTLLAIEGPEIYGEIADAEWTQDGEGDLITGVVSEGTLETLRRIDMNGIEHVRYRFESESGISDGLGRFLRPEAAHAPASAVIRIEPLG